MKYKITFLNGSVREFKSLVGQDLGRANLRNVNLIGANLRNANLENANLSGANLRNANLSDANLRNVNLIGANLIGANLGRANLWNADLEKANLSDADLENANLERANLRNANLWNADLRNANLENCREFVRNVCPEEGSFICYKKCKTFNGIYYIVILKIPSKASRIGSIGSRKFRVSKAKIIRIEDLEGNVIRDERLILIGKNYSGVKYKLGKTVKPDRFDESDRVECSNGIHAFISKQEALEW